MTQKIVASQPLKKQTLTVWEEGIVYTESAAFGAGPTFRYTFDQIDAVVKSSSEPILSIQVGSVIHSIPFKKNDDSHRAVIDQIVAGAQRTLSSGGA
jgi:hypothetical protein